jgi:hypothetical protein
MRSSFNAVAHSETLSFFVPPSPHHTHGMVGEGTGEQDGLFPAPLYPPTTASCVVCVVDGCE